MISKLIDYTKCTTLTNVQITEEYNLTLFNFINLSFYRTRLKKMRYNAHIYDFINAKSWDELTEFRTNRGL